MSVNRSILTCAQWVVGSEGTLVTQYTLGGVPSILIPLQLLNGSGLCNTELGVIAGNGGKAGALNANAGSSQFSSSSFIALLMTALGVLAHLS